MATKATTRAAATGASKIWIAVAAAVGAAGVIGGALILTNRSQPEPEPDPVGVVDRQLGYAEGVVAVEADSLQAAIDEMYRVNRSEFATEYKNDAFSEDGKTFSCYIGNSPLNTFDMYIQIFADAELTDELFLSDLVRPGMAFNEITLEHELEVGEHRVYVVFTQVRDDLVTMEAQVAVTMDFTVLE